MQKRKLGNSDLMVNPVGLGCMGFSHASGDPVDNKTAVKTRTNAEKLSFTARSSSQGTHTLRG